ncbi:hypothetical protein MMC06_002440 [Schaereria dolodes]|nr:hypothetical protein [Schaereria dolodes]
MAKTNSTTASPLVTTRILPINTSCLGYFSFKDPERPFLEDWNIELSENSPDVTRFLEAVEHLKDSDIPVAIPTETVYGLAADATRSSAVLGIYRAKNRPADNPLIVHICSLSQLRSLLFPHSNDKTEEQTGANNLKDPIPDIYQPLIKQFWPGPLTILLANPPNSNLAPEVTAGLPTFGVRMPSSLLALALIKTANIPLAAPSANTSTRPSPTTAQHVKHDLDGRIDVILDGGPCEVGVESTVVDGLSDPPAVLRPGGISIEQLRGCKGWENVVVGYKDGAETGKVPRAPGMKYKHYSPRARVILLSDDTNEGRLPEQVVGTYLREGKQSVGVLRTKRWPAIGSDQYINATQEVFRGKLQEDGSIDNRAISEIQDGPAKLHQFNSTLPLQNEAYPSSRAQSSQIWLSQYFENPIEIWDISLGNETANIARGLFSALRELDQKGVDVIFVEGIDDSEGDAAAAVMNRLRKAAEIII